MFKRKAERDRCFQHNQELSDAILKMDRGSHYQVARYCGFDFAAKLFFTSKKVF